MSFRETLGKELIISDGAMGTQLQKAGLAPGESPLLWNVTHPEEVRRIHSAYLEAGARMLITNTFGASPLMLTEDRASVKNALIAGIKLAKEAVDQSGSDAYLALNIGPLGKMLQPLGDVPFETAVELFTEQVLAGAAMGVDLILIQTMIDTYELKAAVLAAREASDLPIVATVALNEQGRMLNGAESPGICALLEGLGVDALGINCGAGPREFAPLIAEFRANTSLPLVIIPNAGLPVVVDGQVTYPVEANEFARLMKPLITRYAAIAGGCCGTTASHIKALAEECRDIVPRASASESRQIVTSYATTVFLDGEDVRIDRRIDASTNAALAEALERGDYEYAVDEAFDAVDDDAQIIGISVSSPGIREREALPQLVEAIQGTINRPLMLITADLEALERALRIYNGCALVDLSRFAPEQQEAARACAASYGAVCKDGE